MKITIETIPHVEQRYPTVGDWQFLGPDDLIIRVSEMGNWRYSAAVAVHELVEALLCKNDGVTQGAVDVFDMNFTGDGEPGDDPASPYNQQHCFATAVERMLIAAFGVSWTDYEDALP
jgi:hypothetical protein